MSTAFDFSGFGGISAPSNNSFLGPWGVYDMVEFDGISDPISGKRNDNTEWKAWDFKFKSPKGTYSERIFEPDENGIKRRKMTNANGHEYELPSDFERSQQVVAQIVAAYNPTGFEKLKATATSGKIKTFEQFINVAKNLLEKPIKPTEEHNIKLKLLGRNSSDNRVYARLPNCGISRNDNKPFMEKFIGENVLMTSWEAHQADAYHKAKPSNPEATSPMADTVDVSTSVEAGEMSDIDKLLV